MKWIPLLLLFPSLALAQFGAFEREFVVGTSNILARSGITLGGVTRTNWPTGGGSSDAVTNATGPGITVDAGILTLSTNGWQFGAALTPWTTNIDAAGFSLDNVGTLSAANINLGDGSLADMLASRLSTNFNGAWLVGSGGITNITGGGTWSLSGGAYTFTPTGITAAVQSALNSKVTTNAHLDRLGAGDGGGLTNLTAESWSLEYTNGIAALSISVDLPRPMYRLEIECHNLLVATNAGTANFSLLLAINGQTSGYTNSYAFSASAAAVAAPPVDGNQGVQVTSFGTGFYLGSFARTNSAVNGYNVLEWDVGFCRYTVTATTSNFYGYGGFSGFSPSAAGGAGSRLSGTIGGSVRLTGGITNVTFSCPAGPIASGAVFRVKEPKPW